MRKRGGEAERRGEKAGQFGESTGSGDDAPGGGCVQNPSFYDEPGDDCDNDRDGTIHNPRSCDDSVGNSAEDFARAMRICDKARSAGSGSCRRPLTQGYKRRAAPKGEQHGVLPKFGDVLRPREGKMLGVLSMGFEQEFDGGREPFNPGRDMWNGGGDGALPPGFPKAAGSCPRGTEVFDVISLKLERKAPKNATGFRFDFDFFSSERPKFICSKFNDGFIA